MGRPPLNMTRTHISIPPETLARIDKIVGPKGRAEFIRKAVEKMLEAVEFTQKLEAEKRQRDE